MKQHFKLQHVNEITGAFVILVVLMLIATIVVMAYNQRWFRRTVALQIVLPEEGAAGIRQGDEVHFLGTRVGAVSDVVLLPSSGRMVAETRIRGDFFPFLRTDSFAVVKKKLGVAGESYFDIARGTGPPLPKENASIECKQLAGTLESTAEEIRGAVLPLVERLKPALEAWTTLGTHLDGSRQQLDQVVARLDRLAAGIEQGKGTVGKLMTDPAVADDVASILDKGNVSMDQIQGILKDAQITGGHLTTLSATLDREAQDLPALVAQAQQTLYELQRLIRGIEGVWPIRSHIEQRPPDTRISPSEVVP